MAVTATTLKEIAPELSTMADARLDFAIAVAGDQIAESVWGDVYDRAVTLLSLHIATCMARKGNSGAVTQKSVGEISTSYSGATDGDGYETTSYGQMYVKLRDATINHSPVVG